MTTRNITVAVVVLALLGAAGYFFFNNSSVQPQASQEENGAPAQGKINIDAVCEGALAYMTFPDAASAEVFVAECKEGKHPEVIEHYKAQMGLGEGAEI